MHHFKQGDVIKCISSRYGLVRDQTYTVTGTSVRRLDGSPLVKIDGRLEDYLAERFVLVSESSAPVAAPKRENVDVREEQLRAMLTTTSDPFTCKKCGAPKATCTYH